jgi:hypothetical protein
MFASAAMAVLPTAALAEQKPTDVRALADGAASPIASIVSLSWLEGRWLGEGLGGKSEEVIAPALGGQMMGMFRQSSGEGELQFYEFYAFAEHEGSLVLRLKHFNPDLTGWEEKDDRVLFPLVAIEGDAAYFDGITYRRTGDDTMTVAVNIGDRGVVEFGYTRAD